MRVIFKAYNNGTLVHEETTIGCAGLLFNVKWAINNGYSFTTQRI